MPEAAPLTFQEIADQLQSQIENNLIHTLVIYWSLDRSFKHEPTDIVVFFLSPSFLEHFFP